MRAEQRFEASSAPAQQADRRGQIAGGRCYTQAQVCAFLQISERTFFRLKRLGKLTFLEELPRVSRFVRYRADLVDAIFDGKRPAQAGAARSFLSAARKQSHTRQSARLHSTPVSPQFGQGVSR